MDTKKNKETNPGKPNQGDNNPDEAMTTPKEVEQSNDANIEKDFPGYPHYPANEDLLDPDNKEGRVDLDVDNLTRSNVIDPLHLKSIISGPLEKGMNIDALPGEMEDDLEMVQGTDADVTADDLAMLG